jgi:hypothetical protein
MKFIVVNGRIPRRQCFCSLCSEPIGETYLRETATRLSYCDYKCYVGHRKLAFLKRSKSRDGAVSDPPLPSRAACKPTFIAT